MSEIDDLRAQVKTLRRLLVKSARGTLSIAKTAMPDSYFKTDRRCRFAREMLKKHDNGGGDANPRGLQAVRAGEQQPEKGPDVGGEAAPTRQGR